MSTRSRWSPGGLCGRRPAGAPGAAGAVTDGLARDVKLIREMRFPVFCGGIGPLDSKGRGMVMTIEVPVECGGVHVAPGDWIFGDIDGVCVIPSDLAERTITLALEKVAHENTVREELAAGELLRTVFARHQIL
jgi:4-hydroxy-4-methyl-2-oxoglutarate aldolase